MRLRDLFQSDVTRDIPPVVYFHEQSPEKLEAEVSEYIVTGGWPEGHPNHKRVPEGIHEQYVRLITGITDELDKPGGPDLPTAWVSGFYGSGKSSFAKLLGLALDGKALPGGGSLAEAWLKRNTSPRAGELREAWKALRVRIDPIACVFDIGGIARDNEHIHAAAVRQVQRRLGYCATEPLVADFELRLERDGAWARFEQTAAEVLGRPWSEVKDNAFAEEDFSHVLSVMFPERYTDPMSWITSRGGTVNRADSPDDAVNAIRDMLKFRAPGATLFLVVDEVSQYVLANQDRVDRLRAFAAALGSTLRGRAWLVALGQQRVDEDGGDAFLLWAKDRFPPRLRVHLAATNIRDVVHKRLLQKRPEAESALQAMFDRHRPDLKLYAYGCDSVTPDAFIEVYPMLPGQIDLILQLTSALRTRSSRAQGDDQAIRGLLQLLGELFRTQRLADAELGRLVTLDQVYEVQHTALDADVQASMARVLAQCANDADGLAVRAAKVVALLELIQDSVATDARLIAQCLYERVDGGNNLPAVTAALEDLRRRNLLGYSEKHGYKLQSSAGEEWERERRDIGVPGEAVTEIVKEALIFLLATPEQPRLQTRPFPWAANLSDGRRVDDAPIKDPRDDASFRVDFRFLTATDRTDSVWVKRSAETVLQDRLVWLAGDGQHLEGVAKELHRSRSMVSKYKSRRESLNASRKLLFQQEENTAEDLERSVRDAVASAWMAGRMYFRGRGIAPQEHGAAFATALHAAATRLLPELYPQFIATQVGPSEVLQLLETDLSGPSTRFLPNDLGILSLDAGRYVPDCAGVVPTRICERIEAEGGMSGTHLLSSFARPPYGYAANVVKACVAGLLRAGKVRVQPDAGGEITAIRDAGVRELFDKDRAFRGAAFFPAGEDEVGPPTRARICKFFDEHFGLKLDRDDNVIADAIATQFQPAAKRLRTVLERLQRVSGGATQPEVLRRLGDALEDCLRVCRQTLPAVKRAKKHLDALSDGMARLRLLESELTDEAIQQVRAAHSVLAVQGAQLGEVDLNATNVDAAIARVSAHLDGASPWLDVASLDDDLGAVRDCYVAERRTALAWQEREAEAARARIKSRNGFATLTGDQSHQVLRPVTEAMTTTTAEAVAPSLRDLKDRFTLALQRAEAKANDLLDELLSVGEQPVIRRVDLQLHNREIHTEAEVEALVTEVRTRLLDQLRSGARLRLT
jgi:hypothetical protein